jgi:hypothetical protein
MTVKVAGWIFVMVLAVACSGKRGPTERGPLSATEQPPADLPTTTRAFEEQRQVVLAQLDTLQQTTDEVLQEQPATEPAADPAETMPSAVEEWNRRWDNLVNEFDQLRSTFDVLAPARDQHFADLNQMAAQISDRQTRRGELRRNSRAYAAFNREYRVFYHNLGQVRRRVQQGRDLHLVLNVTVKRRQFRTEDVARVRQYAQTTRQLAHEMDSLLRQGHSLADELEQ